jgi:hypothetical protein
MSGPIRVQVQPLSEQRWSRIERSLFARHQAELLAGNTRPGPTRLGGRWLAHWAILASAVALLTLAFVVVRGSFQRTLEPQQIPSRITTGDDVSHLALPGVSLDLKPQSTVVIGPETSQGMLIVVDRGGLACEVAPRVEGAPLIVQAGGVRVRVIGTRFSVSRRDDNVRVEVEHGVVEVSEAGRTVRVSAGQSWSAPHKTTSEPTVQPAPSLAPTAQPSSFSARPEARGKNLTQRNPPVTSAGREQAARPEPPASTPQRTFEEAARLEARDPARAAALYASLEAGRDVWAQNALYARGRLLASRGNAALARQLLTRYLSSFPHGTNADDARAVLGRLR